MAQVDLDMPLKRCGANFPTLPLRDCAILSPLYRRCAFAIHNIVIGLLANPSDLSFGKGTALTVFSFFMHTNFNPKLG
ncbi:MAG: hypothetical protein ACI9O0_000881 [Paracoccaceae bacterium]|jgi:hypothetical protein